MIGEISDREVLRQAVDRQDPRRAGAVQDEGVGREVDAFAAHADARGVCCASVDDLDPCARITADFHNPIAVGSVATVI